VLGLGAVITVVVELGPCVCLSVYVASRGRLQPGLGVTGRYRVPQQGGAPMAWPFTGTDQMASAACRWRRAVTLWALSAVRITVM
jgi:hypothetical protein